MTSHSSGVVDLLVEAGVFTEQDVAHVRGAHVEQVLNRLLEKRVLSTAELAAANELVRELSSARSPARKLKAQVALTALLGKNLQRRVVAANERIAEGRRHITGESYPVVQPAAAFASSLAAPIKVK